MSNHFKEARFIGCKVEKNILRKKNQIIFLVQLLFLYS